MVQAEGQREKELTNREQRQRGPWAPAPESAYVLWESQQDCGYGGKGISGEIITENIPDVMRDTQPSIEEAQRGSSQRKSERPTRRHIIIRLSKDKEP